MKKLFLIAVMGILTLSLPVNAQEVKKMPEKGEIFEMMREKLSLTDNQVAQIKAIDARYEGREKDVKSQMQKVKAEYKEIKKEKRGEIDKVLTAEQREKIKAWKEERQKKRKKGFQKMKN